MIVCYLCGDLISKGHNDNPGAVCNDCGINYCSQCVISVSSCFRCSNVTERFCLDPESSLIAEKIHAKQSLINNRRHPREEIMVPVEYYYSFASETDTQVKERVDAMTKNISEGGICIITSVNHNAGQKLNFSRCSICSEHSYAEVRWSKMVDKTLNIAGLEFI